MSEKRIWSGGVRFLMDATAFASSDGPAVQFTPYNVAAGYAQLSRADVEALRDRLSAWLVSTAPRNPPEAP